MIPKIAALNGGTLDSLVLSVSLLGILLIVGTMVRLKVGLLRKYHVTASLVAGLIGLALGPFFLGVIPKEITSSWAGFAGRLITFVFAPMLMFNSVRSGKGTVKKVASTISFGWMVSLAQYAIPMLLSALILIPLFPVDPLFSVIVEEGWLGGHGTAGGMAQVFEELGWADGASLSITSATVGLIWGILSGMILINIAVRKGWTHYFHDTASLKAEATEVYPEEERPAVGRATIENGVIDPLAFHFAILCVAVYLGWIGKKLIDTYLHISITWYVTALFAGLLKRKVMTHTPWKDCLDRGIMSRIQGICLELLVTGAVASVNIPVVVKFAVPLIIQQGVMMAVMFFGHIWYVRHFYGEDWFEYNMLHYGEATGVFATGMLLLKTCDPELKSNALEILALSSPFSDWAIGGGVLTAMMPYWVMKYGYINCTIATTALALVLAFVPKVLGTWHPFAEYAPEKAKAPEGVAVAAMAKN